MVVDGARALYTSQVVALATAGLASLFLTFAGFYLSSNTIRRDLIARTGGIIAATPVSSGAYLVGKFRGGAAYLGLITAVYVLNVMAMHLLRGEGPLEPFTYFLTYALALGPAIIVVASLALAFECVSPLRVPGRRALLLHLGSTPRDGRDERGWRDGPVSRRDGPRVHHVPGACRQQFAASRHRDDAFPG